jgi:DNA-binding transcriptional LysR family regulator
MYDWDDLRIFLAAARAPSLTTAAKGVALDTATVGRRLTRLETGLKATLFERSPSGLRLTAAGTRLMESALAAESAMNAVARACTDDAIAGTVRLSVSEGFGVELLAPALPQLHAANPNLRIELAAQTWFLSPSKREADIAVTLAASSSARLVVEALSDYELGLFAAPDYLAHAGTPTDVSALTNHEIVGYIEDLLSTPELRYLDQVLPSLRPTLSSSSIQAQHAMIEAGGGIGVLPCFLSRDLKRVLPHVRLKRRFWLNIHRDSFDTARVRATRDWLQRVIKNNASRLLPHDVSA